MKEGTTHLLLQIVYPDGRAFQMPAGGPLEMELKERLSQRLAIKVAGFETLMAESVAAKDVGFFRTAGQVQEAMRESFRETVKIDQVFREAFEEVMFEFKDRVANP